MIKYTLITLFTSITLFFSAALADGVVIEHNVPYSLNPGESTVVSVLVNKGDVTGFAKLQLEIPSGLSARAVKKNGASFTFSGQKAKFIWMSLPDAQQFSIEYELTANATAEGSKIISGQFSYIMENERVDYDLTPQAINIGGDLVQENSGSDTTAGSNISSNSTAETITSASNSAVSSRIISKISDIEYFIEVSTLGVETDGFSKLVEDISEGFEINATETGESIVTVEEDRIKFVWFEKPADDSYSISYSLVAKEGNPKPEINGVFSFINNSQPMETTVVNQEMISSRDFGGANDLAEDSTKTDDTPVTTTETAEPAKSVDTNQDKTEPVKEAIADNSTPKDEVTPKDVSTSAPQVKEEVVATTTEETDLTASNVPDPETGITYKVQLSATHKYVNSEKFKSTHNFTEPIQTENHEGWTKFVTGSHGIYKDARDSRNGISSAYPKFKGPFVTAYNSGERITVQEALMISKQKWYQ